MKKFLIRIFAIIFAMSMCLGVLGCGDDNRGCATAGGQFNIIHIFSSGDKDVCLQVKKWEEANHGVGMKIWLNDGNCLYVSEGRYLLAKDYCPICGKKES